MIPTPEQIRSIYLGIENRPGLVIDVQGWNSSNPIFERLIRQVQPKVVVEVGVWKFASLIHMAKLCRTTCGLPTVLFGVDAWFGHVGDMIGNPPPSAIPPHWSQPTLYEQGLFNVKASGLDHCIVPVWQLSRWGADCLKAWGVIADLIYIDAAHDEDAVFADLNTYWPILREGGIMFGDDYSPTYCGVPQAVERFSKQVGRGFHVDGSQWYLDPK